MSQIGGVRPIELVNGSERGVRALKFNTGSGLEFLVVADRALDIAAARYRDIPLDWLSPTGLVAPAFYDSLDLGWLWSMGGGLLVTCGLTHAGPPELDGDEELGLHGRIANSAGRNVAFGTDWDGDDYMIWAVARYARAACSAQSGSQTDDHLPSWRVQDLAQGCGGKLRFRAFSFDGSLPLQYRLSACKQRVRTLAVVNDVEPRDKAAARGVDEFDRFSERFPATTNRFFSSIMIPMRKAVCMWLWSTGNLPTTRGWGFT
jgi:hypothetical protein